MWNSYIDQVVAINDMYFPCFLMWVRPFVHDAIQLFIIENNILNLQQVSTIKYMI